MPSDLALAVVAFILLLPTSSTAQSATPDTTAVCRDEYSWMNNEEGQSPCLVSAYLEGSCLTGHWTVPALPAQQAYNGPSTGQANICTCSTVTYSTMSACGACQTGIFISWGSWANNCGASLKTVGAFAPTIPANTSVPAWAFIDPTSSSTFNQTRAKEVADQHQPDIRGSNGNIHPGSSSSSTGKKHSNTGAIAGGVVGAIVVVALFVTGISYLLYNRRKRLQAQTMHQPQATQTMGTLTSYEPSDTISSPMPPHMPDRSPTAPPPYVPHTSLPGSEITPYVVSGEDNPYPTEKGSAIQSPNTTPGSPSRSTAATPSVWSPTRLYDPEDPSTYPPSNFSMAAGVSHTAGGTMSPDLISMGDRGSIHPAHSVAGRTSMSSRAETTSTKMREFGLH